MLISMSYAIMANTVYDQRAADISSEGIPVKEIYTLEDTCCTITFIMSKFNWNYGSSPMWDHREYKLRPTKVEKGRIQRGSKEREEHGESLVQAKLVGAKFADDLTGDASKDSMSTCLQKK